MKITLIRDAMNILVFQRGNPHLGRDGSFFCILMAGLDFYN